MTRRFNAPNASKRWSIWYAFAAVGLVNGSIGVAQGQDDLTDIPEPDPVAERAAMRVMDGCDVNLFAADPDIAKPIQTNFDCQGNLWVATSTTYPQITPGGSPEDRIVVLRDTDGDGVADRATTFADGLLIPTGVVPDGPDAAYVADSTELVYLRDTDGDGRADVREVVLSGFGTEDTHHLLHTLRWGPDGCLYFNQSIYIHSHIDTPDGRRHLDGGGVWRFHPPTGRLEIVCKGFINPWGHEFDADGNTFVTDGAFFEGINYAWPDAVFVTSPGATRWVSGLNPGSPKHCGLAILSGDGVPESMRGQLITNDFRSHRVCRFEVTPSDSTYASRQQAELVTSSHVAFRPIDARMGPDGALYIADWYNPIIQHGEVDFRDPRRDRTHGRIWRLTFGEGSNHSTNRWPDFSTADVDDCLGYLSHASLAVRDFARQRLWKLAGIERYQLGRGDNGAWKPIAERLRQWRDEDPPRRTGEVLYFLQAAGASPIDPHVADDLSSAVMVSRSMPGPAARVVLRSIARLNASEKTTDTHQRIIEFIRRSCTDPRPAVRLEAVAWAGRMSDTSAVAAVLGAADLPTDPPTDFAIWQSLRSLDAAIDEADFDLDTTTLSDAAIARAAASTESTRWGRIAAGRIAGGDADTSADSELWAAAIAHASGDALDRLVELTFADDARDALADRIGWWLNRRSRRPLPGGFSDAISRRSADPPADGDAIAALYRAAVAIDDAQAIERLTTSLENLSPTTQTELVRSLVSKPPATLTATLVDWSASDHPPLAAASIDALAKLRPRDAANRAIRRIDAAGDEPSRRRWADVIVGNLNRKPFAEAIGRRIEKPDLAPDSARQLVRAVNAAAADPSWIDRFRAAGGIQNVGYRPDPDTYARWAEAVASMTPEQFIASSHRGEQIYRRDSLQCVSCHAIGAGVSNIGPNLISLGGSSPMDYIIESIIDPSAKLKEGYTTANVLTYDGVAYTGIAIGESDDEIKLRSADGKEITIAKDDIELRRPGKSLMPAGLVDRLSEESLVDLFAFLSALGRHPDWTVSPGEQIRVAETLIYTPEANRRLNRTSTDTAASDDPAMRWRPITSTVDARFIIPELDAFKQHRQTPPTSFIRFTVSGGGPIELSLDAADRETAVEDAIDLWIDGRPTTFANLREQPATAGNHTITMAIQRDVVGDAITIVCDTAVVPTASQP